MLHLQISQMSKMLSLGGMPGGSPQRCYCRWIESVRVRGDRSSIRVLVDRGCSRRICIPLLSYTLKITTKTPTVISAYQKRFGPETTRDACGNVSGRGCATSLTLAPN